MTRFLVCDEWQVKILIPISSYRAEIHEHKKSYNSVAVSKCKWDKLLFAISQLFTCLEPAKSILLKKDNIINFISLKIEFHKETKYSEITEA